MMVKSNESMNLGARVQSVDVLKNMILVATANLSGNTWDANLVVIDDSTKEVVATLERLCGCADVCWTTFGQRAVCAEDSGDVKVYKMDQEAPARLVEIASLKEHDDIVSTVAASHSHEGLLLSGSYDRSVNIWDIESGKYTSLDTFTGHSGIVTGAEWSGDDGGQVFASSSTDCSVRLWDRRQAQGCRACLWLGAPALSVCWDTCSQDIIGVGCEDGTVAVLDTRTFSSPLFVQETHAGRVNKISFGPAAAADVSQESTSLASVGDDGVVAVRRPGEDSYLFRSKLHTDYAQGLAWSDENTFISGGWDSELCFRALKYNTSKKNIL